MLLPLHSIKQVSEIMLNTLKAKDNINLNANYIYANKIGFNQERSLRAVEQANSLINKYSKPDPELKPLSTDPFYLLEEAY